METGQEEYLLSTNKIARIEATDFNVVCSVGKLLPLGGVKCESIGICGLHPLRQRFGRFSRNDMVVHLFTLSDLLVVHNLLRHR